MILLSPKEEPFHTTVLFDAYEQANNPNIDLVPASKRIAEMIEAEWDLRYNVNAT